ncbi:MAG: glycerate kinase family protein [Thermocrispum sp.]
MKVLVAPDKFKGSLTAVQAARHIARGVLAAHPGAEIIRHPIADGGEGTVDAVVAAGFQRRAVTVSGPLGEPVRAAFGLRGDVAVVELAQACGSQLLQEPEPMRSTSHGGGELLRAAVEAGARRVVLGVGGVACTDGGRGMLESLGARFTGDAVDLDAVRPIDVVLASDVDNPLLGPDGAARVYSPQKGATPAQVEELEARLTRLADLAQARDLAQAPGAGAAGGVAFGAMLGLGARRRPGFEVIADLCGLPGELATVDVVVTGEGRLDGQSLRGKAPVALARMAVQRGLVVIALCGSCRLSAEQLAAAGISRAVDLASVEPDHTVRMRDAGALLERLASVILA